MVCCISDFPYPWDSKESKQWDRATIEVTESDDYSARILEEFAVYMVENLTRKESGKLVAILEREGFIKPAWLEKQKENMIQQQVDEWNNDSPY
jgi:hypothetical protein